MLQEHRSRPLWARELKPKITVSPHKGPRSRPLWARELKPDVSVNLFPFAAVAPLVGA